MKRSILIQLQRLQLEAFDKDLFMKVSVSPDNGFNVSVVGRGAIKNNWLVDRDRVIDVYFNDDNDGIIEKIKNFIENEN